MKRKRNLNSTILFTTILCLIIILTTFQIILTIQRVKVLITNNFTPLVSKLEDIKEHPDCKKKNKSLLKVEQKEYRSPQPKRKEVPASSEPSNHSILVASKTSHGGCDSSDKRSSKRHSVKSKKVYKPIFH